MNILLIVFAILYLFLAICRIDWAVMLILATLPSYLIRFQIFGIPFTLLELMILISFAVWFIQNWRGIYENLKIRIKNPPLSPFKKGELNPKLINYPFGIEAILVLIISYIAVTVADFSNDALGIWKAYFFEPILLYILVVNVFNTNFSASKGLKNFSPLEAEKMNKIFWPLCISAFFISIFAIYQKFTGAFIANPLWAAEATRRVTSLFDYPNALGLFLAPITLLLTGWVINRIKNYAMPALPTGQAGGRQELRIKNINLFYFENSFIIFTIIFSLTAIYFAKSEGALIGVFFGLIVFGLLFGRKVRRATIIIIALIVFNSLVFLPLQNYAKEKIALKDLSGEIRKQQWRETWQMLNNGKLIQGTGLSNYQTAIKPYHQEGIYFNIDRDPDFRRKIVIFDDKYKAERWQPVEIYMYPHNIILNFWAELGLAGMLIFIWIIVKYFIICEKILKKKYYIQNTKYIILGLIGAMVAIIIHGLVDVPYFKNDLACLFWVMLAILSILIIDYQKKQSN